MGAPAMPHYSIPCAVPLAAAAAAAAINKESGSRMKSMRQPDLHFSMCRFYEPLFIFFISNAANL